MRTRVFFLILFVPIAIASIWRMDMRADQLSGSDWIVPSIPSSYPEVEPSIVSVSRQTAEVPSVHSASIVELGGGKLRAFWFGGSREGAEDVSIWTSLYDSDHWSAPTLSVDRDTVSRLMGRFVRKLGNPVVSNRIDGGFDLFVVGATLGGWSGSSINRVELDSSGEPTDTANRLVGSPFFNISTLVRGSLFQYANGDRFLPAYHESIRKFSQTIRVGLNGRVLDRQVLASEFDLFQPTAVVSGPQQADLFLRRGANAWTNKVYVTNTKNGGIDWSEPSYLPISNPNAAISVLRTGQNEIIMACNRAQDRRTLSLLLSANAGETWTEVYVVDTAEREPDELDVSYIEYSYPALNIDSEGVVHLLYTWNRREIRHLRIGMPSLRRNAQKSEPIL